MFTFEKSRRSLMVRNISDKGMFYTAVPIFNTSAGDKTYAMFYGRLRALFGEPNSASACYNNMYRYDIKATASDGKAIYLGIAHIEKPFISLPADRVGIDTRPYKAARKELIMSIMCTKPADYVWRGFLEDAETEIVYRVKNGIAEFTKV